MSRENRSRENRLWSTERIRGELLKLHSVVSNRSIRRYRWAGPARSPSQTWRTFMRDHAHCPWAADPVAASVEGLHHVYERAAWTADVLPSHSCVAVGRSDRKAELGCAICVRCPLECA